MRCCPSCCAWWRAGETVGVGTVVGDLPLGARARRAPRCWSAPTARPSARCPAAASRARSTSWRRRSSRPARPVLQRYGVSDDDAFAVGPDLRRHPRRVRREGRPARPSPSSARSPPTSRPAGPVAVATVIEHPDPAWLGRRRRASDPDGRTRSSRASLGSLARADDAVARRRAGAARQRHQRHPDLRPRRRAPRRGHAGLRLGVRAQAADAGLRRDRLRRRGGPGRQLPRLPRDGLRRPARSSPPTPASPRPTRSSSSGRTATSRASATPARIDARTVIAVLTHDPKFDVPAARGGAAPARGRLRRGDGLAAHPRGPAGAAARGRAHRRRAGPAVSARSGSTSARARPRRPPSRSPPRSSPCAGAVRASGSPPPRGRSTTTIPPTTPPPSDRKSDPSGTRADGSLFSIGVGQVRGRQRFQTAVASARTLPSKRSTAATVISGSSAAVTTACSSTVSCSGAGRRKRTSSPAVT